MDEEEFRRFHDQFMERIDRRQRRAWRNTKIQMIGVAAILGMQLFCNSMGWSPYPYSMLWVCGIVAWGIVFLWIARREANRID